MAALLLLCHAAGLTSTAMRSHLGLTHSASCCKLGGTWPCLPGCLLLELMQNSRDHVLPALLALHMRGLSDFACLRHLCSSCVPV